MSDPNQPAIPAGWYPDGLGGQRWWDGTGWTEHTQPPQAAAAGQAHEPYRPYPPAQQPYPPAQQPSGYGQPYPPPPTHSTPGSGGSKTVLVLLGAGGGALVLLVLVVVAVRALGGAGPDGVAQDYLKAQFESDYGKVCELSAEDAREALLDSQDADDCGEFADRAEKDEEEAADDYEDELDVSFDDVRDNFDQEIEVEDVEERGDDEAVVTVRQRTDYKGDDAFLDEVLGGDSRQSRTFDMLLVEEDGDWRVADPEYAGR